MNYDELFERSYAYALAENMRDNDGTAEYEQSAREYAVEFAAGEVQAAIELIAEGRYSRPHPAKDCSERPEAEGAAE